jgi:ubiquinone/menaquinone biosynthesis C-methylase UbiE
MSETEFREKSRDRFGQFAAEYIISNSHAVGYDLNRLVEISVPQSHWISLDIATGGGHTALRFASHVRKVIATDITPQMLSAAREHIIRGDADNIEFSFADSGKLPFGEAIFDLVTCRIAPHHFLDCARFILEGYRVLVDGDILLVQDHLLPDDQVSARYIDDFERHRDPSHNRAFSRKGWIDMFTVAGFVIEHIEEITKRHDLIPWAARQGCSQGTVTALTRMLEDAPPLVAEWLQVVDIDTPGPSFVNHHILIKGRK